MASQFRDQRNRLLRVHSLIGIFIAFFLYIVCFSGTFALFTHELTRWADGGSRIALPDELPAINQPFDELMQGVPEGGAVPLIVLTYPTEDMPYYDMMALAAGPNGPPSELKARWSGVDGSDMGVRGENLPEWLAYFHTDLWLPYPFGRSIIGLSGLLMLLIVITGVFLHRQPIKDSFQWRADKNLMTFLFDSHSTLGLWGFLFHTVIAFTGAVLGLASLLGVIFTVAAYTDGKHAELEPMPFPTFEAEGIAAKAITPDEVSKISKDVTGVDPALIIAVGYGKDSGIYRTYYEVEKPLVRFGLLDLKATTGEVLQHGDAPANTVARSYISILPLHVGSYGGIALKVFYGVLGASLCLIIITGIMMWLERAVALDGSKKDARLLSVMGKLSVAVCAGFPLAVFAALYADQFITAAAGARPFAVGSAVFILWGATAVLSFLIKGNGLALRWLLGITALLLAGLPVLNYLVHGDGVSALLASGSHSVIVADITFIALALGTALLVRKLRADASA